MLFFKNKGFTLLELIVSVMIISVLAASVSPNLMKFKNNYELTSAYNIIVADLKLAQNYSMNTSEIFVSGKYQHVYYGIQLKSKYSYALIMTDKDFNVLKQMEDTRFLSNNNSINIIFNEDIVDSEYIMFDKKGNVSFLDINHDAIPLLKNNWEIGVSSSKVSKDKYIDFNEMTGKIVYERE